MNEMIFQNPLRIPTRSCAYSARSEHNPDRTVRDRATRRFARVCTCRDAHVNLRGRCGFAGIGVDRGLGRCEFVGLGVWFGLWITCTTKTVCFRRRCDLFLAFVLLDIGVAQGNMPAELGLRDSTGNMNGAVPYHMEDSPKQDQIFRQMMSKLLQSDILTRLTQRRD